MKRSDLAKAEAAARKVERRLRPIVAAGAVFKRMDAHELVMAMKLIRRHEKIGSVEIWARTPAPWRCCVGGLVAGCSPNRPLTTVAP